MLHDTIMSLVVVLVIIGLACAWKWSVPGNHSSTASGEGPSTMGVSPCSMRHRPATDPDPLRKSRTGILRPSDST